MTPLELSDAEIIIRDGYPLLRVTVNGQVAVIEPARKPDLFDAGLVPLGDWFNLPPIEFKPATGGAITLEGFTDDKRLFEMYADFSKAAGDDTLEEGPLAIPSLD